MGFWTFMTAWTSGLLIASSILVTDEILTLALYCGLLCRYPFPLLGAYHIYDGYSLSVGLFLLPGVILGLIAAYRTGVEKRLMTNSTQT